MSLRTPAKKFERMPQERYFTPPSAVWPLMEVISRCDVTALRRSQAWECAAGQGHVAKVLERLAGRCFASDIEPPEDAILPVAQLDFLKSSGPSGCGPLAIVTNPPYGRNSELAMAFLKHGLDLLSSRGGFMALLLPFEFDSRATRNSLVGRHPCFAAKITLAERVRWVNLPQKTNDPMGHHSWFCWSYDGLLLSRLRRDFRMVSV